ncbi:MAG: SRPBCC domain-containing protein [Candidatus Electryonea clarkiae]|nr:SRPBCC domain-containing protein [Candidatus Electryonea clarkiae]MDP8288595.1 SRPBCC domain-containing protein [Candidatus Electryonea clarkiae]
MATEKKKKRASVTVDVRVPTKIAWRAITDEREMQIWFAQHVHVDLKKDGFYNFSGKYVPFLSYDENPEQKILEFDEDEMNLSFEWKLRTREGEIIDTVVKYRISPMNEFSRLDIDHIVGVDDLSDDDLRNLWTILLNGFVFHMEGASAWVRPEFTPRKSTDFQLEIWTAAHKEDVYQTLTTIEGIKAFFAPQVKEVKLEEGGMLDLGYDKLPILEFEENSKFAFGWREVAGEDPNLTVTWELKDEGNGTRISLHEGTFDEPIVLSSRPDYDGWAAVMNDLKRYLETRRHPIFLSILIEPFSER